MIQGNEFSCKAMKEFIFRNRNIFTLGCIIMFLVYSSQINYINIRFDTESVINYPGGTSGWLTFGRQGAILTRMIFRQLHFNPYFAQMFSFILYAVIMIMFSYTFYILGDMKVIYSVGLFLLFIISPIITEQMYFQLQVIEVAFALLLVIVSVWMTYLFVFKKRFIYSLSAIIMMIWAISTYQLFAVFYISLIVYTFILLYRKSVLKDKVDVTTIIEIIIKSISIFIVAMLINAIITGLFFSSNDYVSDMIVWKKIPIGQGVKNILMHIKQVMLGEGVFFSLSYSISIILVLVSLIKECTVIRRGNLRILYYLSIIVFCSCPFLLTIYTGSMPAKRVQFILPFVSAANLMFAIHCLESYCKRIAIILSICMLFTQTQDVMRLLYTDDIRQQEDLRNMELIYERIIDVSGETRKPVAFIGEIKANLNNASIRGESIGLSVLTLNSVVEPHYYMSSLRTSEMLQAMGMNIESVNEEQLIEARKSAANKPRWPSKESVYDAGDMIVVKLSDDQWYLEDILGLKPEIVKLGNVNFNSEDIQVALDEPNVSNNILTITGWAFNEGVSSDNASIQVYLYNESRNEYIKIPTVTNFREGLTEHLAYYVEQPWLYSNSAFCSKVDLSLLDIEQGELKIVVQYINGEESIYSNTDKIVAR